MKQQIPNQISEKEKKIVHASGVVSFLSSDLTETRSP